MHSRKSRTARCPLGGLELSKGNSTPSRRSGRRAVGSTASAPQRNPRRKTDTNRSKDNQEELREKVERLEVTLQRVTRTLETHHALLRRKFREEMGELQVALETRSSDAPTTSSSPANVHEGRLETTDTSASTIHNEQLSTSPADFCKIVSHENPEPTFNDVAAVRELDLETASNEGLESVYYFYDSEDEEKPEVPPTDHNALPDVQSSEALRSREGRVELEAESDCDSVMTPSPYSPLSTPQQSDESEDDEESPEQSTKPETPVGATAKEESQSIIRLPSIRKKSEEAPRRKSSEAVGDSVATSQYTVKKSKTEASSGEELEDLKVALETSSSDAPPTSSPVKTHEGTRKTTDTSAITILNEQNSTSVADVCNPITHDNPVSFCSNVTSVGELETASDFGPSDEGLASVYYFHDSQDERKPEVPPTDVHNESSDTRILEMLTSGEKRREFKIESDCDSDCASSPRSPFPSPNASMSHSKVSDNEVGEDKTTKESSPLRKSIRTPPEEQCRYSTRLSSLRKKKEAVCCKEPNSKDQSESPGKTNKKETSETSSSATTKSGKKLVGRNVSKRGTKKGKKWICPTCKKTFNSSSNLSGHKQTHNPKKNLKCPTCKKSFRTQHSFRKHTLTHNPEKNFVCSVCKKAFRTQQFLRRHQFVHKRGKPHKCPQCPYASKWTKNVTKHLLTHRKGNHWPCSVCQKKFHTPNTLQQHKRSVHNPTRVLKCPQCPFSSRWPAILKTHKKSHKS